MKRLKALFKMELPPVLVVGIYFMIINLISFIKMQNKITGEWEQYLSFGIARTLNYRGIQDFSGNFMDTMYFTMLMYGVGFCVLVYLSFMKDKNNETARFLKALPYSSRERILVKISLGLCCFGVNFIVLTAGILGLRAEIFSRFHEVFEVTALGEICRVELNGDFIVKMLLMFLMVCVAFYLFLVFIQYLVSMNIGSVISSVFIFLAPIFIIISLEGCRMIGNRNGLRHISKLLQHIYMGPRYTGAFVLGQLGDRTYDFAYYEYLGNVAFPIIFWGIFIMLMIIGIRVLCKNNRLEESDRFISNNIFRWIYIAGASVCGSFAFGDIYYIFLDRNHQGIPNIVLMVGLAASFWIAYKVAYIGSSKKHKEVRI